VSVRAAAAIVARPPASSGPGDYPPRGLGHPYAVALSDGLEHEDLEMAASSPPTSTARRRPRAVRPGHVLALVLAVLAVIFIAQNRSRVHMSFFTVDVSAPAWLLLTTMTRVGLAVGLLLGRMKR
jgi:uncharacterized integral membrane protein